MNNIKKNTIIYHGSHWQCPEGFRSLDKEQSDINLVWITEDPEIAESFAFWEGYESDNKEVEIVLEGVIKKDLVLLDLDNQCFEIDGECADFYDIAYDKDIAKQIEQQYDGITQQASDGYGNSYQDYAIFNESNIQFDEVKMRIQDDFAINPAIIPHNQWSEWSEYIPIENALRLFSRFCSH